MRADNVVRFGNIAAKAVQLPSEYLPKKINQFRIDFGSTVSVLIESIKFTGMSGMSVTRIQYRVVQFEIEMAGTVWQETVDQNNVANCHSAAIAAKTAVLTVLSNLIDHAIENEDTRG